MSKLVESLEKFNRKERYWLLKNALKSDSMVLGEEFRKNLGKKIGISIPENAWWAMDYHLDWLIGALSKSEEWSNRTPQPK